MNIVIYGIEETDYICSGCKFAKALLDEAKLPYDFKRIVRKDEGTPIFDKELMAELSTRIKYTTLTLPYIFIDDKRVKLSDLKPMLEGLGYDLD